MFHFWFCFWFLFIHNDSRWLWFLFFCNNYSGTTIFIYPRSSRPYYTYIFFVTFWSSRLYYTCIFFVTSTPSFWLVWYLRKIYFSQGRQSPAHPFHFFNHRSWRLKVSCLFLHYLFLDYLFLNCLFLNCI